MTDTEAQPADPSASQPTPAPIAERRCDFVPFPGSGAYGHWRCELSRWHWGSHRFINYTIARVPRVWHVRHLWGQFRCNRRLARYGVKGNGSGYGRALYPATYRPIEREAGR